MQKWNKISEVTMIVRFEHYALKKCHFQHLRSRNEVELLLCAVPLSRRFTSNLK